MIRAVQLAIAVSLIVTAISPVSAHTGKKVLAPGETSAASKAALKAALAPKN